MSELPRLDAVLLSHDHYDHLDFTTMRLLRRVNVPIVTSLGVGAHLEAFGIAPQRIVELDWWESHRVPGTDLTLTATPSQHFSGRGLKDGNKTLWSSWVHRLAAAPRVLQRRYRADARIRRDARALRRLRPGDAGDRRLSSRLGRHSPRSGERARRACLVRRRSAAAHSLGHVQSRAASPGTIPSKRCCAWRRRPTRGCCCPGSARPSSPRRICPSRPGGAAWMRGPRLRRRPTKSCRRKCPGPSTDVVRLLARV